MAHKLVCTIPFAAYQRGDEITDSAEIEAFLETHPRHVVRVAVEGDPEAAKPKAKKA